MKVLYLGSNENKKSEKELKKIEICWKEVEKVLFENKMLQGNLIIWSKYRWNIKKWIFGKLTSLIF